MRAEVVEKRVKVESNVYLNEVLDAIRRELGMRIQVD